MPAVLCDLYMHTHARFHCGVIFNGGRGHVDSLNYDCHEMAQQFLRSLYTFTRIKGFDMSRLQSTHALCKLVPIPIPLFRWPLIASKNGNGDVLTSAWFIVVN